MSYRAKVAVMAAMAKGRRCVDRGSLKAAIRRFDEAVRLDGLCAQAYLYRAGLKLLVDDEAGALADFRALETLDHAFLPAYRDLTTLSAEEFPALIKASEKALRKDPACAWAWVFHAFSLRSLMLYEEAVADLDRAVACRPDSAALWAMRSRVKLTNTQAAYEGVADMEKAVALAPHWGWLNCWLGEALRHRGDQKRALASLTRGLELDPRYRRGFAWRGGVRVALGQYALARRDLDTSLAFDPIYYYDFEYTADQKSWAYNQRQLASRGLGETEQALKDLNQAHRFGPRYHWVYDPKNDPKVLAKGLRELDALLKRKPRHVWALAWKGKTLQQAGRGEEALPALERATTASPRTGWPWAWKGKLLVDLGRAAEGLKCLDKAIRLDAVYAPAWGWRAEAKRLLGRLDAGAADYSRAVELDHRAAWCLAGRGECRLRQGALPAALADLDRALAICPGYAEAHGWRAEARRQAGRLEEALQDADAALKLKPGLVLVYVTRALVKQGQGDLTGQLADFRRAAKLDPSLLEARG